ncbi:adenylate/guanylate cyclase domain-containing protein [Candidatus Bipolaricaulota bacterium]
MMKEHRKLAVVMFTDIAGYTALAQHDEAFALELLREHNHLQRECFAAHDGREIKSTGDGFLVVFESPVRSIECALDIQSRLALRREEIAAERAVGLRIGIHLGDIVHRDGDVLGDGVNVASRIEPLAEPGGICVSRQVYDHVWNKVPAGFVSLGHRELKNLREAVEVFRVTSEAGEVKRRPSRHDRTRVVVLPFANISPNPSDAYFADGMTEELIYALSRVRDLQVIAHTSSLSYKNADKGIVEIGEELQVGSVVEGSVRKAGNALRITLQLIDVAQQKHIWSQRYDRELEDVFAIQGDIAQHVAEALQVQLLSAERQNVERRATENPDAYSEYLQGRQFLAKRAGEDLKRAGRCFRRAIELDPGFANAYAGLAEHYFLLPEYAGLDPKETLPKAREAALRALEIDETEVHALTTLAMLRFYMDRDPAAAEDELKHVLELHPGSSEAHGRYGFLLLCLARLSEALDETRRALTGDPVSLVLNRQLGILLSLAGKHDEAIEVLRKALELDPGFVAARMSIGHVLLAKGMYEEALVQFQQETLPESLILPQIGLAYVEMGREDDARRVLADSIEASEHAYVSRASLGALCLALGEEDRGFQYLEEAYEEGDSWLHFLNVNHYLAGLQDDPRLVSLKRRLGLAPPQT